MAKPIQDAIDLLETMRKVLTPDGEVTAAQERSLGACSDKLNVSRALIERSLHDSIRSVNDEARLLSQVARDLDTMLRTLSWLDSARDWKAVSRPGAVVHNAKARMVMSSADLKKSLSALKDVSRNVDDLNYQLGL